MLHELDLSMSTASADATMYSTSYGPSSLNYL